MDAVVEGVGVAAPARDYSKVPPRDSPQWRTPMFEQYWKIKDGVPGALLFYRMGDFYELFGHDALIAAPLLEVQLTARDKDSPTPIAMCGVPVHAIDSYAEKLLGAGHKVALCEQLTTPPSEGGPKTKLVERGVVRILTPGLPVDPTRLEAREPHWFVSLAPQGRKVRVLALDFLKAELREGEVEGPDALHEVLQRLRPKEILLPSEWKLDGEWKYLADGGAFYRVVTPWVGRDARANLEDYLLYTQRCPRERLGDILPEARDLSSVSGQASPEHARLPVQVLEQWDVFPALVDLLDKCGSAVGSRRLRALLASPLRSAERIALRQEAYALLGDAATLLSLSRELYDFERILGRFRVQVAAPKELLRLLTALRAGEALLAKAPYGQNAWDHFVSREGLAPIAELRARLQPLRQRLEAALVEGLDLARLEGLAPLLRPGFDAELDRLVALQNDAERWLQDYENGLKERSGIPSLKLRYNRVFGYYIEVTKTHLAKVPPDFERKQTTANGERFTTQVLRERESEILGAGAKMEARARELLQALQNEVLAQDAALRAQAEHLGWIDALAGVQQALRAYSRFGAWTKPQLEGGPFHFSLEDARHPVIEAFSGGGFIANSLELDARSRRVLLLTGPNMAGKSTLMRQTGLCLLLAQCGLPVPAKSMKFAPCSGFYSRMGASDRILQGESTFMVEMKETAALLREADSEAFVLVDEIGRGTSTQDGLSIAQAVLEHVHHELRCVCIFATHYHELTSLAEELPNAVNGSMGIREWKGDLVFLRTLDFKPAEKSYGIHVAKMAGLPKSVLARAKEHFGSATVRGATSQMDLFASAPQTTLEMADPEPSELEQAIAALDVDSLSPREAWAKLEELKGLLPSRH